VPARSVLRLEQGTEQGQLPQHATEDLQQNPEQSQYQEKSAEPCHDTWTHQANHVDSDTHSMHTAPPAPRHPRLDSDTMQNALNEKYRHTESAPWSARHHPFGEGHGHTGTVLGPVQGSEHGLQFLANKELQMQILHPTRENKVRPHHQVRTSQTKTIIQSRPMCTTHPAPRYHQMGGSYPKTSQKGHGSERELNYSQDAQGVRRRGGMRGGSRGSPQDGSGSKGRGFCSPGGEGRQMGGSYVSEDNSNHTTPPETGGRGRGRGNRFIKVLQ